MSSRQPEPVNKLIESQFESHNNDDQDNLPTWMLFVFSIDRELPSEIKWTNRKTNARVISEKLYNERKNRKVNDYLDPESNGIYQCERNIANKIDKVNVILNCSDHLKTTLVVNPSFWKTEDIAGQNVDHLQNLHKNIPAECDGSLQNLLFVKWAFRSNHHESYRTLTEKTFSLDVGYNVPGEYRCIVKLNLNETQVYYFLVKFLEKHLSLEDETPETADNRRLTALPSENNTHQIINGVPSVLQVEKTFLYFGYGSNLLQSRLRGKNPSADYKTIAKLEGYKLDFISMKDPNKSLWNGGVATITQSESDHVWGAVWKLDVDAISSLNKQEGFYKAVNVVVESENGTKYNCRTYLLEPDTPRNTWDNRPSYIYKAVIINGACECKINNEYIAQLLKIDTNKYAGPYRRRR